MSLDNPIKHFPDIGTLIQYMDDARARGDEELRAQYNPMYERAHYHYDGWGTHAPLLASVVATARPGPVLEIGIGRGSSPLLVEMCAAMGRVLFGLDSEEAWIEEVTGVGGIPYANVFHMPDWSLIGEWIGGRSFAVIFIDHGPSEARLPVLEAVRHYGDHIVCHDTFNPGYLIGFDACLDTFRYRYDYKLMPSCTSVVSDTRPYPVVRK